MKSHRTTGNDLEASPVFEKPKKMWLTPPIRFFFFTRQWDSCLEDNQDILVFHPQKEAALQECLGPKSRSSVSCCISNINADAVRITLPERSPLMYQFSWPYLKLEDPTIWANLLAFLLGERQTFILFPLSSTSKKYSEMWARVTCKFVDKAEAPVTLVYSQQMNQECMLQDVMLSSMAIFSPSLI